ncbi:MAG: FG-GAP repeat protein [Planctomycetes bacterium]|nr:FG-GAP repeat protein [Planctomycetota bacterium]
MYSVQPRFPLALASVMIAGICANAWGAAAPAPAQDFGTWSLLREHDGPTHRSKMGWMVTSLGDVNQDGIADYLTTAPYADDAFNGPFGRAYIYSGANGSLIREHQGTSYGGRLGIAAANVGDLDGDLVNDYSIGIPWQDRPGGRRTGAVWTYSGATGQMIWEALGQGSYWLFGREIVGTGDVDGDGTPDVLVSAPEADIGSYYNAKGMVYLLSGVDGSVIWNQKGKHDFDYLGGSLAAVGDLDGDGTPDFCASGRGGGLLPKGTVHIFSGATGQELRLLRGGDYGSEVSAFGNEICSVGDWDQDGFPDVAISSPLERILPYLHSAGAVRIFSGHTGELLHTLYGDSMYSDFGSAICKLDDFDGDGTPDLAVGLPVNFDDGGVRVYSGRDARLLWSYDSPIIQEEFGYSIADGGDLNGDGRSELLVGSIEDGVWIVGNGSVKVMTWDPHLIPGATVASASAGGSFTSQLHFPISEANQPYALLLSETGTGPARYLNQFVPLSLDPLFWASTQGIYPSLFGSPTGVLDANGEGSFNYQWSPAQLNGQVGHTFWACAVTFDPGIGLRMVSIAVPLTISR